MQFLHYHSYAVRFSISLAAGLIRLLIKLHQARIGALQAGDNTNQRALAGAVLAYKGVNLSFSKVKVNRAKRADARERLADVTGLKNRFAHCRPH
jgi:hypothetical protein